jgi:thiol-disulfide isomerase/thioredoxin
MNQYLKILLFGLLVFAGCEDESDDFEVSQVPSEFTKKVLIEEFTGTWCGYCPDGAHIVESIIDDNDGRVVGVSLHSGDAMEIAHTNYLETTYQNPEYPSGYPSGMVDRVSVNGSTRLNRGYWEYVANDQLLETAVCGLAIISEVNGQNATVEVHAGFNSTVNGDYRLSVYLIEDGVTGTGYGYDQRNSYNTVPENPFNNLGDPIVGYEHNHTLRAVLSESLGDAISPSSLVSGGEHIETYTVDLSSYNKNNLSIVAFVTYIGSTITEHEIMNVQKCDIDGFQDWD